MALTAQEVLCVPQSNVLKISSGLLKLQKTSTVISYREIPVYPHLSAGLLELRRLLLQNQLLHTPFCHVLASSSLHVFVAAKT